MAEIKQWTVQCRECKASVEYNCNTCGSQLCSDCKDKHQASEQYKHHVIVSYSERVIPISHRCKTHPDSDLVAWCDTCNKTVCTNCMTSPCHERHLFKSFHDKVKQRKDYLQKQYEETKSVCSMWQTSLANLEEEQINSNKSFENIESEIKLQGNSLHARVSQMEDTILKELQCHRESCQQKMIEQKGDINKSIQSLEQNKNEYESILRSQDAVAILEFKPAETDHRNNSQPHSLIQPEIPSFRKGQLSDTKLEAMLGKLAFDEEFFSSDYEPVVQMTTRQSQIISDSIRKAPLKVEAYVIPTSCKGPSALVCISMGMAWIGTENVKLKLLDKSYNISDKKLFKQTFCDIAQASTGQLVLLTDVNVNCVSRFSSDGKLYRLFTLNRKPHGICVLMNDTILITFRDEKKVMIYNLTGEVLMDLTKLIHGYPLFAAQSKINRHVYITVKTEEGRYRSPGKLLAVKENGELIFEYNGQTDAVFTPIDVCADRNGQVFVTDYIRGRVHILNTEGIFLRYLMSSGSELVNPCRIDINDSKFVWIGENETEKIKVLQIV